MLISDDRFWNMAVVTNCPGLPRTEGVSRIQGFQFSNLERPGQIRMNWPPCLALYVQIRGIHLSPTPSESLVEPELYQGVAHGQQTWKNLLPASHLHLKASSTSLNQSTKLVRNFFWTPGNFFFPFFFFFKVNQKVIKQPQKQSCPEV